MAFVLVVWSDREGNLFITDNGHLPTNTASGRIQKLSTEGIPLAQWSPPGAVNVTTAVALDGQGNVFLAYVSEVGRYSSEPGWIYKLSQDLEPLVQWGDAGRAPMDLRTPRGVTIDAEGNLFVTEPVDIRIQRLSAQGDSVGQWGSRICAPIGSVSPWGIVVDSQENLYVTDPNNKIVPKLSFDGEPLAQMNLASEGFPPYGVAVDGPGNAFVTAGDRIVKLSPRGELLAQWGTRGTAPGQFNSPMGIAVDSAGNVYVADTGNNRIQKLSASVQP